MTHFLRAISFTRGFVCGASLIFIVGAAFIYQDNIKLHGYMDDSTFFNKPVSGYARYYGQKNRKA